MGALGSQIQEYLRRYPTTFAAYEKGISTWSTPFSVAFEDWYLPAMVEELSDWTYQEDILCTRLNGSPHPKLWAQLLPYAFGMMQPLSLESALRWENAIANFSNDIKTAFYARIEEDAGHQLAQMELERPLHEQGYWERLALALPHMHGRLLSRKEQACFWERVWRFLTQRTWTHSNGMHAARIGALWAQYVPLDCVEDYLRRATLLLQHPIVQWDAALLDLVVCRARNEDEDGVMLGVYPATTPNSEYISTNSNAGYVEFLYGLPRNKPDEYYDTDMVIDYGVEFRAYVCGKENGQPNYNWVDVTDSGLYSFINRQFTWLIDKNSYVGMIRTNKHVFHRQVTISPTNGVLSHEIQYISTINGVTGFRSMSVPMNQIAVYLNGHLLIENLDYVLDFPTIYIVSKEYFTLPASPRLNIIFTGLCNSELKIENNSDVGFVSNGLLSNNNKFDLRDNRILRIAVGGKLKSKDDLLFAEEDAGVTVPHVQNGLPYSITEIVVPVYSETGIETTVLRNEANVIDTAVSDYLTSITPPPVITTPNPVLELHTLYSPFLSKIIFDLKNDVLVDQRILRNYSDPDVVDICKNYTYLLDVDLAKSPSLTDPDFVIIHPHLSNTVISLDIYKYRFVLRVLKVFFNNRLDISGFVNLL